MIVGLTGIAHLKGRKFDGAIVKYEDGQPVGCWLNPETVPDDVTASIVALGEGRVPALRVTDATICWIIKTVNAKKEAA